MAQSTFKVYNDGMTKFVLESGLIATVDGGFVSQTNGSDGTIDNQSIIYVSGDWENNNSGGANVFLNSAGSIVFNGTSEQILGGTAATTFYDLEIDNSTVGGGVTVNKAATIQNTLTLTDGFFRTSAGNQLIMSAGSTASSGSNASYVDGPMQKIGNTAFSFPLGNGGVWARLTIGAPSSSSAFEARYYYSSYSNTSSLSATPTPLLNNVSTIEYWTLERVSGTGKVTVQLHWENAIRSQINDCADLKLARWSGGAWENTFNTAGSGSCVTAGFISSGAALSEYVGPLTFGSLAANPTNPLPITLQSFDVRVVDDVVLLNWVTATELNNDYFTIEKSLDGRQFELLAKVQGKGTTFNSSEYTIRDINPYQGYSYYRLKQTDFDGTTEIIDIASIYYDKRITSRIFPNPVTDNRVNIRLEDSTAGEVRIQFVNQMGHIVYYTTAARLEGGQDIVLDLPADLQAGLYFVVARSTGETFRSRMILIRE